MRWPRLKNLLENTYLQEALLEQSDTTYCDRDPLFDESRDSDFSHRHGGILKERFALIFQPFLKVCVDRENLDVSVRGGGRGREGGRREGREGR